MKEINFQKKFFFLFKECLNKKNITVISGTKEAVKEAVKKPRAIDINLTDEFIKIKKEIV